MKAEGRAKERTAAMKAGRSSGVCAETSVPSTTHLSSTYSAPALIRLQQRPVNNRKSVEGLSYTRKRKCTVMDKI